MAVLFWCFSVVVAFMFGVAFAHDYKIVARQPWERN